MKPVPLTKGRFLVATECPRKLTYLDDTRYVNTKADDEFLESLARAGHQIGELARAMHPEGIAIQGRELDGQVEETRQHLNKTCVTLFEATFRVEGLVIRADILIKEGERVRLIEVKSKSFDRTQPDKSFRSKNGIRADWRPYLRDITYQTHVVRRAYPNWTVIPYLMLIDPTAKCTVDSIATKIRASIKGRQVTVALDPTLNIQDLHPPLLVMHDVTSEVTEILNGSLKSGGTEIAFVTFVEHIADLLARGVPAEPALTSECRSCEFYCVPEARTEDQRSGWAECMELRYPGRAASARSATVFGLYNDRKTDQRIADNQILLSELDDTDLDVKESPDTISPSHRHHLQIMEVQSSGAPGLRFLRSGTLRAAFDSWRFPLHFIDFETARPCLPFHTGHKPNQLILFQFSHHVLDADGQLAHRTQCLNTEPGEIPNVRVLEELREALGVAGGTVIHWWDHERTVLAELKAQLEQTQEPGHSALISFVDSMLAGVKTTSARMVDLGRLVSDTAFFAGTGGSSSIKKVLPAILQQSWFLEQRYGAPIYGSTRMPSLNYPPGWIWWRRAGARIADPYTLLEPIFSDNELNAIITGAESNELAPYDYVANGGAAMVVYGQLQRPELPSLERTRYQRALLRYCELDTLAMVMVYEALQAWVTAGVQQQ